MQVPKAAKPPLNNFITRETCASCAGFFMLNRELSVACCAGLPLSYPPYKTLGVLYCPQRGRAWAFPLRVNAHARFHCLIPPLKPLRDFNCPQRGRPSLNIVLSLKPTFNIVLTLRGAYRNLSLFTIHYSLFTIHYPLPRSGKLSTAAKPPLPTNKVWIA